jgi:hypothetical protein
MPCADRPRRSSTTRRGEASRWPTCRCRPSRCRSAAHAGPQSKGFFPAETVFSERAIPVLASEGTDLCFRCASPSVVHTTCCLQRNRVVLRVEQPLLGVCVLISGQRGPPSVSRGTARRRSARARTTRSAHRATIWTRQTKRISWYGEGGGSRLGLASPIRRPPARAAGGRG